MVSQITKQQNIFFELNSSNVEVSLLLCCTASVYFDTLETEHVEPGTSWETIIVVSSNQVKSWVIKGKYTKSQNSQNFSSIDVFTVGELNDTENNRKISTSSILEEYDSEKYSQTKEKRVSDSINLINLSDTDITEKQNKHFSMPKSKASCSSVISIESANAANFEANSIDENTKIQGGFSHTSKLQNTNGRSLNEGHEINNKRLWRKSSNASCCLSLRSENSELSDKVTDHNNEEEEGEENILKDRLQNMPENLSFRPRKISREDIESENVNLITNKKDQFDQDIKIKKCNVGEDEAIKTISKTEKNVLLKDSEAVENLNVKQALLQHKKKNSLQDNYNSQNTEIISNSCRKVSQKKRFTDDNDVKNYSPFLNSSLTNQNRRLKNSLGRDDEEICDVKQDFIISQKQKNEFFENEQNSQLPLNNIANESCIERTECNDLETRKQLILKINHRKEDGRDNKLHPSDKDYARQPKRKKVKKDHNFGTESDTDVKKTNFFIRNNADAEKEDNPQQFQPEDHNFNPESDIDVKKSKHLKRKKEDSSHHNFSPESDMDVKKGKHLKRKTEAEKEDSSHQFQSKRPRKAAIKAKNRNKIILNEKHFDNVYQIHKPSPSHIINSNDEIKDCFDTPPTKPVKKKRFSRKSVFMTDTETGSSEISWFALHKTGLFETPKKKYSNRRSKPLKDASSIKKTYKSASSNKKRENEAQISHSLNQIPNLKKQQNESNRMLDSGKSKLRFVKKTSPDNILHSDDSAPKTLGVLSAESLSPFVEEPKLIHIMKYLESLSGESNSPQNFEQHDNFDQVTPFEENCKTKCYAKSSVDSNLSRCSNSEKYSSEENMSKQLSPVRGSINFKNKKISTNVPKSRSKTTCTTEKELPQLPFELAQLPLLDNYTNSLEEKAFTGFTKVD
ncbi:SYCP2_SLD domain-containing protein [Caerostris extrusa]|uniref:SYCP2_SLD domain-containing protein n=1 Tax=Caerostris extrusa TaxID=172846 RepID=A0AAV4MRL7_CAEEX|nr:SYCP2_SLD domain-containing protein [Caerostris extrusa]